MFDNANIINGLKTEFIGKRIKYLETTTSTNNVIREAGENLETEGLVVIAEEQTEGRGRQGKKWETFKGDSIAMSVLLRPEMGSAFCGAINLMTSVAIVEGIMEATGVQTLIKWPNDIYLDGLKIGGILSESAMNNEKIEYVAVGIGININQKTLGLDLEKTATSIKKQTNKCFDRVSIIIAILNNLEKNYKLLKSGKIKEILDKYKQSSLVIGKKIVIIAQEDTFEGTAVQILDDGSLKTELTNGETRIISSGEISLRLS